MSARDEWDALSLAHRVEAMKEIDEAVARCSQRAHDHEKRGDTARQIIASRKAAMLVDMLKEQETEHAAASRKAGGRCPSLTNCAPCGSYFVCSGCRKAGGR